MLDNVKKIFCQGQRELVKSIAGSRNAGCDVIVLFYSLAPGSRSARLRWYPVGEKKKSCKQRNKKKRMTVSRLIQWSALLALAWSVPIDRNVKPAAAEENKPAEETPETQDTGLYYDRYLREVIDVLETDSHFREKLQAANADDIKVRARCTVRFV
ncbi:uncharacterized protein LOC131727817 isoform X2 [Acipenser ruthenus]|uniref:uncharacterized protein LOC131727817 isoform X2 n=1 Tax=Acipenser ruthenus TaxID=7906 RepID=UPI0027421291|nr:uncharacterized protein LOC131727817 isoform X2 [Acipenser ruthenus]